MLQNPTPPSNKPQGHQHRNPDPDDLQRSASLALSTETRGSRPGRNKMSSYGYNTITKGGERETEQPPPHFTHRSHGRRIRPFVRPSLVCWFFYSSFVVRTKPRASNGTVGLSMPWIAAEGVAEPPGVCPGAPARPGLAWPGGVPGRAARFTPDGDRFHSSVLFKHGFIHAFVHLFIRYLFIHSFVGIHFLHFA
uniref:Uncharacterized protein n=1 Tax=Physcomitrium patens TaxID=3218 RepID=A0A2K1JGC9_PHYPA|nr:hypothetical protein PHYPA_018004 [Physcomitrium patens]